MEFKYFTPQTDPLIAGLDEGLMMMLDSAREAAGIPFLITCGRRTPEKNACLAGAVSDSAHLTGLAVDLAVPDDQVLWMMLYGLFKTGFSRIGLYVATDANDPNRAWPRHLHVDTDGTKPQKCFWVLKERN